MQQLHDGSRARRFVSVGFYEQQLLLAAVVDVAVCEPYGVGGIPFEGDERLKG